MNEEQTTTTPAPKRGVRLSTQIIIWVLLMALLVLVGLGLKKAQNPIISIGSEIPEFSLTMFEGYSYQGASEVKFFRTARQSSRDQFLGLLVQTL
jgi:hypothetical protein